MKLTTDKIGIIIGGIAVVVMGTVISQDIDRRDKL